MVRKLRAVALFAVVMLALMAVAGCGRSGGGNDQQTSGSGQQGVGSSAGDKPHIAVVVKALNSDYWHIVEAGAKAAAKDLNVEVSVLGPNAETDVTGQVAILEDQITKKVDALAVAPSQPSAVIPVLDKAKAAGIPVVLIDTDADWQGKVAFVGTGNYNGGKLGGEYLAKQLGAGAKVAIIRGQQGDPTHDARQQGAEEALKAAGLEIVAVQPANSQRDLGLSVAENILQSHPDVQGFFCTNDEMCLGAVQALKAAGKKAVTVGFDGSPDALKSILEGGLTASVAQSPYNIGYKGVETALKALKGEQVEAVIDTGTYVIDKSNASQELEKLSQILGKSF